MRFKSLLRPFFIYLKITKKHKKEYLATIVNSFAAMVCYALILASFYLLFTFAKSKYTLVAMFVFTTCFCIFKFKSAKYDHGGIFVNIGYELRKELGEKLMNVPLNRLYRYETGKLNSIFSSNVDESVIFINMAPSMLIEPVILWLFVMASCLFVSPWLSLAIFFVFIPILPLYKIKNKLAEKEKEEFIKANASLEAQTIEYIQGLGVLRSINQSGQNALNLAKNIENIKNLQLSNMKLASVPTFLFHSTGLIAMLVCIALAILFDGINANALIATLIVLYALNESLGNMPPALSLAQFTQKAFKEVSEILKIPNLKYYEPLSNPTKFDIEFKDVSFSYYKEGQKALDRVNFKIEPNTMTAIVGGSGSGKTTLIKLLMRHADPQTGVIKIGGVDIKNIKQNDLLSKISVVFQDVYLFNETIKNNILIAAPNANDKEVANASKLAYCYEFIDKLPNGYGTRLSDIGAGLSGGEKQRLSIARAILKDAPIVILDEPTAALDIKSEEKVQKALNSLIKDKTLIIIAHRLSTVINADQILVLDNSKIVEYGTHNELLEKKADTTRCGKLSKMIKFGGKMILHRSLLIITLCIMQYICIGFFSEGLINILRQDGGSLERIGLLRFLGFFTAVSFLWSPFVDRVAIKFSGYKPLIIILQLLTIAILSVIAFLDVRQNLTVIICLAVVISFLTTTQMLASNAFFMKISNEANLSVTNSLKLSGITAGHVLGNGATLIIYAKLGWLAAICFLAVVTLVSYLTLAKFNEPKSSLRTKSENLSFKTMVYFFKDKKAWLSVLLVQSIGICSAVGIMGPMLVDKGWSLEKIGAVLHIYGTLFGFIGSIVAAYVINKIGAKKSLIFIAALQIFAILTILIPINGSVDYIHVLLVAAAIYGIYVAQATVISTMMMQKSKNALASEYAVQGSCNLIFQYISLYLGMILAGCFGYGFVVIAAAIFCFASLVYFIRIYRFF